MKNHLFLAALVISPFFLTTNHAFAASEKVSMDEILNLPAENRKLAALENREELLSPLRSYTHNSKLPMSTRWKALMLITEINPKEALMDLMKASKSSDWYMRNAALVGLDSINPEKAQDLALSLVTDKALVVRSAAIEVLSKNLGPANRDLLWQELFKRYNFRADVSLWIRGQILQALAQKPSDHETKIFVQLLKDKDAKVQAASIDALEKLQGIKLGSDKTSILQKVSLWQDYAQKNTL